MEPFKVLSKLHTKRIIFEEVYPAQDSATLEQLKELSSKRLLVQSINENSTITEATAREMSGGLTSKTERDIQKIEQYLPILENLMHHVDLVTDKSRAVDWTSKLKIRWTSALISSSFLKKCQKSFQIDNLRFELGMILFLYGAKLRERSSEVLSADGVVDLVQCVTLFRRAAGVYHYMAHEILSNLQPAKGPPEAIASIASVMSVVCLAEAQIVTAKKAEEKGNTAALLAKLHHGVAQLYDEALSISNSAVTECKDISGRFLSYISYCKTLFEIRSYKYFAEAQKTDGQIGNAIGLLRHAVNCAKTSKTGEESWRAVIKKDVEHVTELLKKYEHENDFVWRAKIPYDDELPSPDGKKIVSYIPYHPQRSEVRLTFKS